MPSTLVKAMKGGGSAGWNIAFSPSILARVIPDVCPTLSQFASFADDVID
jgi:hypothetical protein